MLFTAKRSVLSSVFFYDQSAEISHIFHSLRGTVPRNREGNSSLGRGEVFIMILCKLNLPNFFMVTARRVASFGPLCAREFGARFASGGLGSGSGLATVAGTLETLQNLISYRMGSIQSGVGLFNRSVEGKGRLGKIHSLLRQ